MPSSAVLILFESGWLDVSLSRIRDIAQIRLGSGSDACVVSTIKIL
jgi:hypothetical protein